MITGRDLAAYRLAVGISSNALSAAMGCNRLTLQRWEFSLDAVPDARMQRWRDGIARATQQRAARFSREGFTIGEVRKAFQRLDELVSA